ncbi:MAG TPA: pyridoxamine 5'-phosphate oxidase family protein [Puia sp.]|nr:pyridoxamine 5'-phosphate oxidase family protein [Puia sp.]
MTKEFCYSFLRRHQLAVLATLAGDANQPQAALVGFAVTPGLEIVFDTVRSSRKYSNLCANPRVALVIGWSHETSVQYEGRAIELLSGEGAEYKETYYSVFPDGRQRAAEWAGLTHFVIRPSWIRYSNFNAPPVIEEMNF